MSATLASAARIVVDAKTNLPDGTLVTAVMKEGGDDFAWPNLQSAQAQVSGGLGARGHSHPQRAIVQQLGHIARQHAGIGLRTPSPGAQHMLDIPLLLAWHR